MRIFLIFLIAAIGTYLIRISGIVLLGGKKDLSPRVKRSLGLVAPAAMGAIIANALLFDSSGAGLEWRAFGAWHVAALVAVVVAVWRRSMGWTLLVGAVVFAGLLVAGL